MTIYQNGSTKVGIDDLSFYIPSLYLPIEALASARELEYDKLHKGLGLTAMAVPDAGEDAATMAANAVVDLLTKNQLDPRSVGRIYLGTESAIDGSKPMATYALDMLSAYFTPEYGEDCFLNCDVVDLTFACIGAVDALQNTLDWVRGATGRIGIVVASDIAKYELGSGGEYTQGAGAVAVLVRHQPRLLAIGESWGVATRAVHDFFKPVRSVSKKQLVEEVLNLAGIEGMDAEALLAKIPDTLESTGVLDTNESELSWFKEMPVFDGPYSNNCYQQRIREALEHFSGALGLHNDEPATDRWERMIFHLPYAFQARRMFPEIFLEEARRRGELAALETAVGAALPRQDDFTDVTAYEKAYANFLRDLSKTTPYRLFIQGKIERGERASSLVGNLYTASIFLSLMSSLEADLAEGNELCGSKIGFFGYGSGSKSKVFEGELQPQWREITSRFSLMESLDQRQVIDYATYDKLHRGLIKESIADDGGFRLADVETQKANYIGARRYTLKTSKLATASARRSAKREGGSLTAVAQGAKEGL